MRYCVHTGVTVWEILTFGARPYPNLQARELLGAIQGGERLKQPETCTLDLYAVLLRCMYEKNLLLCNILKYLFRLVAGS